MVSTAYTFLRKHKSSITSLLLFAIASVRAHSRGPERKMSHGDDTTAQWQLGHEFWDTLTTGQNANNFCIRICHRRIRTRRTSDRRHPDVRGRRGCKFDSRKTFRRATLLRIQLYISVNCVGHNQPPANYRLVLV